MPCFQIDFLRVGNGDCNGDAIALRYWDGGGRTGRSDTVHANGTVLVFQSGISQVFQEKLGSEMQCLGSSKSTAAAA
jgi:hypothetical protein